MSKITAKSYSLLTERGNWLGQVVLTSDGMFAAVTDYGNFSFAWRSYGEEKSIRYFEDFLLRTNEDYFGGKMYQGIAYIAYGKKIEQAADRFATEILLPLKNAIIKSREEENTVPAEAIAKED